MTPANLSQGLLLWLGGIPFTTIMCSGDRHVGRHRPAFAQRRADCRLGCAPLHDFAKLALWHIVRADRDRHTHPAQGKRYSVNSDDTTHIGLTMHNHLEFPQFNSPQCRPHGNCGSRAGRQGRAQ